MSIVGETARFTREAAQHTYSVTTSNIERTRVLDEMALRLDLLHDFVYEYTTIEDELINTDDEIINWTFVDVIDDGMSAVWSTASGFYKPAVSSLRNAFELAMVSLAFHIENNVDISVSCYRKKFGAWDRGEIDTPNWSFIKSQLSTCSEFALFDQENSSNIIQDAHAFYHKLCAFTHSRTRDKITQEFTNSMWIGVGTPTFDLECFERIIAISGSTLAWIAAMWTIAFPKMLADPTLHIKYKPLFSTSISEDAFQFASRRCSAAQTSSK